MTFPTITEYVVQIWNILSVSFTHFAEVQTDSKKLYKAATHFAQVKTDSPKLYNAITQFAEFQTHSPKSTLRKASSTRFEPSQNELSEALQCCYTLCESPNGRTKTLQDVKTDSPKLYKTATRLGCSQVWVRVPQ